MVEELGFVVACKNCDSPTTFKNRGWLFALLIALVGLGTGGCVPYFSTNYMLLSQPWLEPQDTNVDLVDALSGTLQGLGFDREPDYTDRNESWATFSVGLHTDVENERINIYIGRRAKQIRIRDFHHPVETDFMRKIVSTIQAALHNDGLAVNFVRSY